MYQGGLSGDLCFEPYQVSSQSSDIWEALSPNIIVLFHFWDLPSAGGLRGGWGGVVCLCVLFFLQFNFFFFTFMPITQCPKMPTMSLVGID